MSNTSQLNPIHPPSSAHHVLPPAVRDWEHLEQLVTTLLAKIDPSSKTNWNVRLPRRLHKGTRQVDTVVEGTVGGVPTMLIVNSKQLGRNVGPGRVDELKGVMREVGAQRGVIVSTKGFSRKALETAGDLGIFTYVLRPAVDADWDADNLIRGVTITGNLVDNVIDEVVLGFAEGDERAVPWPHAMWLVEGAEPSRMQFIDRIVKALIARPGTTFIPGKLHTFLVSSPLFFDLGDGERRTVTVIKFRAHPSVVHSVTVQVDAPQDWVYARISPDGTASRAYFEFAEINAAAEMEQAVRLAVASTACAKHPRRKAKVRRFDWQGLEHPRVQFDSCCEAQTAAIRAAMIAALKEHTAKIARRPPVTPGAVRSWKLDEPIAPHPGLPVGDASRRLPAGPKEA